MGKAFLKPILFGSLSAKPRDYSAFKDMFEVLKFLNAELANKTAQGVYGKMLGKAWYAKFQAKIKATGAKIKVHLNKAGKAIKGAFDKLGHHIKAGAKKIGASIKGGLKVKAHVKVPKVKVEVKGKVAAKPKVGLKVKGKVAVKPKLKVKAKVGVKHRRLQAPKDGFQPPLKPATPAKKDDKKPATPAKKDDKPATPAKKDDNVDTTVTTNKDGLPVSEYSKDVAVPADLEGSSDQTAPKSSNLIKFAFMLFAAFMTMF